MLKLRTILLYDYLYYALFIVALIFSIYHLCNWNEQELDSNYIEGVITNIYADSDKVRYTVKDNDYKYLVTYYLSEDEELDYSLGDRVSVTGEVSLPSTNINPNIFSYQKYLKSKGISYVISAEEITLIKSNHNIFYVIKNFIIKLINSNKASTYLYIFILGDNSYLDSDIKSNYQTLGISHLFSVSGMHLSILTGLVIRVLKKVGLDEYKRTPLICLFVIFYMALVGLCPSVLRSGVFFILLSINTLYYFNIKVINILLLGVSLILISNPYIVYNAGFLYSSVITGSLIIFSDLINERKNYLSKLFMTSVIAFFFSLPISLYNYYQINFLTSFYNLIFVPLVSLIIFPLSLISLFITPFSYVLNILIKLMENLSSLLSNVNLILIFSKPSVVVVLIYYLIIYLVFRYRKKFLYVILLLIMLVHYNYNSIFKSDYMLMIDVGQGDSILLHSGNNNILIDTGGVYGSSYSIATNTTIPLLKSLGIRKLDALFLTHGDYDHVGETTNLLDNFKVGQVYFNEGGLSSNEEYIISYLEGNNISYDIAYEGSIYRYGNYTMYSLNTDLSDENDSSLVLYGKIDDYTFLLMGDASVKSEEYILSKYNLDIDILKVGHHGSRTSSSEEFISSITPTYALISAGVDNKFSHPHEETLTTLQKYHVKYYVTNIDGAIKVNFKKRVTFETFGA